MLSLRLMLLTQLSYMELMAMVDMLPPTPWDTLPTTMAPTLTPMEPDTLARGLLMPSLRLMPLSSMEIMDTPDMLDMLHPIPLDILDTVPMVPTLTPMVPDILARGLLMLSLRLRLLSSMETMDTPDMLDMLLLTPLDTLDTVPMVPTPTPMELTPTLDKLLNTFRRSNIYKQPKIKRKHMIVI